MSSASVFSRIAHQACAEKPSRRFKRWWDELDDDFPSQGEAFGPLGLFDRLRVEATAVTDRVVRTGGACLLGSLVVPTSYHPGRLRHARAEASFYGGFVDRGDPAAFFASPPEVAVHEAPASSPRFLPDDGVCLDLSFQSPFVPVQPRHRDAYLAHEKNRTAHARLWRHLSGPRNAVIAVHGFGAHFYPVNEWFFALPWLYRLGYDVALFTLPFHGRRQDATSPFTGYGFFAGGPGQINEAVAQAVMDLRALRQWLASDHGAQSVGAMGVSLGGYVVGTWAAVDEKLAFAVPSVPVASIPDLALEWQPVGMVLQGLLRLSGWTLAEARYLLAVSSPLSWAPRVPPERRFIIGGAGDRLAPPKHTRLLWDHWDRCRLYWFPGGHLLHLERAGYLRQLARFLRDAGPGPTP